jgi:hypothetical protein
MELIAKAKSSLLTKPFSACWPISKEQFLNLSREQQVKMLTAFYIKGTFWLTPMFLFNGFDEDMETSSMCTSCNVDSSAMPRNTQDSLRGSEREEDGGTPPILFKKKI